MLRLVSLAHRVSGGRYGSEYFRGEFPIQGHFSLALGVQRPWEPHCSSRWLQQSAEHRDAAACASALRPPGARKKKKNNRTLKEFSDFQSLPLVIEKKAETQQD